MAARPRVGRELPEVDAFVLEIMRKEYPEFPPEIIG
jgi:hypothetical protein